MAEILLPDCQFPRLSDGATCRDIQPNALCQACTAHVQVAALRTRLESTEAARRDAQESRFALIVQNEELGAELAATRARLENAEQQRDRLREVLRDLLPFADQKSNAYAWAMATLDAACADAAGERSEG